MENITEKWKGERNKLSIHKNKMDANLPFCFHAEEPRAVKRFAFQAFASQFLFLH